VSRFLSLILSPLLSAILMAGTVLDPAHASLTVCNKTAHAGDSSDWTENLAD